MITTRDRLIASRALAAQRRWVAEAGESAEGWSKLPEGARLRVLQHLVDAKVEGSIDADAAHAAIGALLATIGARPAPLLALPPLVRAIVAHVHDHDASIAVHTSEAARLFGVAPEALDVALRAALAGDGLATLIGGLQAEAEALRAELADALGALADLTAGVARTSEEAAEAASETSRAMRSVFAGCAPSDAAEAP